MQQSTPSSKNPSSPPSSPTREQTQEQFRQYLRQADKLIKEKQFTLAKKELAEAKQLDPTNPFIVAFEERLSLFEKDAVPRGLPIISPVAEVHTVISENVEEAINREALERKIRQKVEEEYKLRFTHELRVAEEHAAKILEEERTRFEHQRHILKSKFDEQLEEIQKRYDAEYHSKLTEDVARAEERLREQYQAKMVMMEEELKTQMTLSHEAKLLELEERNKREREDLLDQERLLFQQHEREVKQQFERQLLESTKRTELSILEQSQQLQQAEREQLRQQLWEEFQSTVQKEREESKLQYGALKKKLEDSFLAEQEKAKGDYQRQLEDELREMRQRETAEFERHRVALRQDVENELHVRYQQQSEEERRRVREESEATIAAEKKRLHDEYEARLQEHEGSIRTLRSTIQREMEQNFLKRMEQIASEYDHKMELLGTKVPQTLEEKRELYKDRMRECYQQGQPTVDDAKKIMALKELLDLTFDEHLAIEADVRLDLYVEHVERMIMSGEIDITKPIGLEEMKRQYRISAQESAKLEPYILSSFQRLAVKGRILLADDDLLLLQSLDGLLTDNGFQVIPAESVEKALEVLKTTAVDLILSDIKFKEYELDGFQFFINVQAQPHLRSTPFVFMSSLRDGIIIRSGIQLGADDYLTKPIEPDLLLAVIEGKLKRYRDFK